MVRKYNEFINKRIPNWWGYLLGAGFGGAVVLVALNEINAASHYERTDKVNDALRAAYDPVVTRHGQTVIITNNVEMRVEVSAQEYQGIIQDRRRLEAQASGIAARHGLDY